jgi:hypothetical protein
MIDFSRDLFQTPELNDDRFDLEMKAVGAVGGDDISFPRSVLDPQKERDTTGPCIPSVHRPGIEDRTDVSKDGRDLGNIRSGQDGISGVSDHGDAFRRIIPENAFSRKGPLASGVPPIFRDDCFLNHGISLVHKAHVGL